MKTSDKIDQVSASLFAVHRDLANPKKNAKANAGKFSYAYLDLPALTEYLRPILREYQLFATQEITGGAGFVEVTTTVWHLSGQRIEFGPTYIAAAGDAQQQGSAMTYCRRYSLAAVFNIAADEDDDATSAARNQPERKALDSGGGTAQGGGLQRPEALGEGAEGRDPIPATVEGPGNGAGADLLAASTPLPLPIDEPDLPATSVQWERLLTVVGGSKVKAVNRLNRVNKTNYTQATSEGATRAEVAQAITGDR